MQCDFDTIGTLSAAADIETGLVINALLSAIGFERFTIHLNNRQVLNGFLQKEGLEEQATPVLRSLDKLAKIGEDKVIQEMMATAGTTEAQARSVLAMAALEGTNEQILTQLKPLIAGNDLGEQGVERLAKILSGHASWRSALKRIKLDVSIARGLDYYTRELFSKLF